MTNNFPALKICGNDKSSGGYHDIYVINGTAFDIPNQSPQGMGGLPYYFMVKLTDYNSQYTLVHNKAKSFQSSRMGVLKLGISIPKDQRLTNNASPYDVLMDVYNAMLQHNMTPSLLDEGEYQFNEEMCSESVFTDILSRYSFAPAKMAHRPMLGHEPALLVTDKAREFMLDPHYPELQGYSEVIVANGGNYPLMVSVSEIPRRPVFQLSVNGRPAQWPCDPYTQPVTVGQAFFDARCYSVTPVTFSLPALLQSGVTPPGVKINHNSETIECTVKCTPHTATLHFDVEAPYQSLMGSLNVQLGSTNKATDPQGNITLSGDEIKASVDHVSCTDPRFIVTSHSRTPSGYRVTVQKLPTAQQHVSRRTPILLPIIVGTAALLLGFALGWTAKSLLSGNSGAGKGDAQVSSPLQPTQQLGDSLSHQAKSDSTNLKPEASQPNSPETSQPNSIETSKPRSIEAQ